MKTVQNIEADMTQTLVASNEEVSYYGVVGSLAGYIRAVALKVRDLWNDLVVVKRDLFLDTARGDKLKVLAQEKGVDTASEAVKAGALLLFTGAVGTVIPQGTEVTCGINNLPYVTKQAVTIGAANPDFETTGVLNVRSANVGDVSWAECSMAGTIGNVPANSINIISIANVTVTNPAPAQGGKDVETDAELRYRVKNYVKLLNHNTQKKYETFLQALDNRILRVFAEPDRSQNNGVILTVVSKNASTFTASELSTFANAVYNNSESFIPITCRNITFFMVAIEYRVRLKSENGQPVNADKHYSDTAGVMSEYYDWSKWEWGGKISLDDNFVKCDTVPQTEDIELSSFLLNGSRATSIAIPYNSLPYFQSLSITDITNINSPTTRKNTSIIQNYSQQQNQLAE